MLTLLNQVHIDQTLLDREHLHLKLGLVHQVMRLMQMEMIFHLINKDLDMLKKEDGLHQEKTDQIVMGMDLIMKDLQVEMG
jgi:hypothetical protein